MNAEIISIGDELLIGQVVNTNATWIAKKLNEKGFVVKRITSISDTKEAITEALNSAASLADIILVTGGLGPTSDDVTKHVLAEYFGSELVFDEKAYTIIKAFFKERNLEVTEINKRQADVLKDCKPIYNYNGTASGMWIEHNRKVFVSMPGVPYEMKAMMEEFVMPHLTLKFRTPIVIHKTILTAGIGESFLADLIKDWENQLPLNVKLAYLPSPGIVRLRLSATGEERKLLERQVENQVKLLKKRIPEYIYGFNNETLAKIVGDLLKQKNKTISTAESCTGGYIGHLITSVSGSSQYYNGSIVSYSNDAKTNILAVDKHVIGTHGAVSEEVVIQMAEKVKEILKTNYSIATSGIAGPDGGTKDKPVGTTWIAVASECSVFAEKFQFGNNRERNIIKTALAALNMLRKIIKQESENN